MSTIVDIRRLKVKLRTPSQAYTAAAAAAVLSEGERRA